MRKSRKVQSLTELPDIHMVDPATGKARWVLRAKDAGPWKGLAWGRDGTRLALAGADKAVKLLDAATGKTAATLLGHHVGVAHVAFRGDGAELASADESGAVKTWDVPAARQAAPPPPAPRSLPPNYFQVVALSPDGRWAATADYDSARTADGKTFSPVVLWDLVNRREKALLLAHTGRVHALAFSPDGKSLLTGGDDRAALVWDVEAARGETTTPRHEFRKHSGPVHAVAFLPGGKEAASGDGPNGGTVERVQVWNLSTGEVTRTTRVRLPFVADAMAFSPDGKRLLLLRTSTNRRVSVWDAVKGEELLTPPSGGFGEPAEVVASADGSILAARRMGEIQIWDVRKGQSQAPVAVAAPAVDRERTMPMALSPDGKSLALAELNEARDGLRVSVYGTTAGERKAQTRAAPLIFEALTFSGDGKVLYSASRPDPFHNHLMTWDAATGRPRGGRTFLADLHGNDARAARLLAAPGSSSLVMVSDVVSLGNVPHTLTVYDLARGSGAELARAEPERAPSVHTSLFRRGDGHLLELRVRGTDLVEIRDADAGATAPPFRAPASADGGCTALAVSRDGRLLVAGCEGGAVRVWDVASAAERAPLAGHGRAVLALAFRADGVLASSGEDGEVRLWDAAAGQQLALLTGPKGAVRGLAFSRDGNTLAAGGDDRAIRAWDLSQWRPAGAAPPVKVLPEQKGEVVALDFSGDGRLLATASAGAAGRGEVQLWDVAAWKPVKALVDESSGVRALAFAPDGKTLAVGGDDWAVKLWDVESGQVRDQLVKRSGDRQERAHADTVLSLAFSADGKQLLSTGADLLVKRWDVDEKHWLNFTLQHDGPARAVFAPDGKSFFTAAADGQVIRWQEGEAKVLYRTGRAAVVTRALSPDGSVLAVADADQVITLWDAAAGKPLRTLRGQRGAAYSLTFSPDGRSLVSLSRPTQTLVKGSLSRIQTNPVNGDLPSELKYWDVATGRLLASSQWEAGKDERTVAFAFSPDGKKLYLARDERVRVLEAATGNELAAFAGGPDYVTALAVSPDGKSLAVGGSDGSVHLKPEDGGIGLVLRGHEGAVWALGFSPDGRTLVSGSGDKTARLWNTITGRPLLALPDVAQTILRPEFDPKGTRLIALVNGERKQWQSVPPAEAAAREKRLPNKVSFAP